jgi:hypothetical protein
MCILRCFKFSTCHFVLISWNLLLYRHFPEIYRPLSESVTFVFKLTQLAVFGCGLLICDTVQSGRWIRNVTECAVYRVDVLVSAYKFGRCHDAEGYIIETVSFPLVLGDHVSRERGSWAL